jgi:hypothetical protein
VTSRAHAFRSAHELWAISDLHVGYEENRRAVQALPSYPDDWLIVAGDTGETPAHSRFRAAHAAAALRASDLDARQPRSVTPRNLPTGQRGVPHYERLVIALR